MTLQVTITRKAIADLAAIYAYGAEYWGQDQAGAYFKALDGLFGLLAEQPFLARNQTQIDPPVRVHPFKSHLIIFRANDRTLDVLRVVHARADWAALLLF